VADGVDPGLVEAVRWRIYDVLTQTSDESPLPEADKDKLLALACGAACDVLSRWVGSPGWKAMCDSGTATVADVIPDLKRVRPFLDPLKETLSRIEAEGRCRPGVPEIGDATEQIDRAIAATEYTGRRYRRFSQGQLFDLATRRVKQLQENVCKIAGEFKRNFEDQQEREKRRKKARSVLGTVATVLLSVSLTMAGTNPTAVRQDIPQWVHDVSNVLLVHHVAQTAQPNVRIAPPHAGPHVG
jgi:hypothetical protein